MQATSKDAIQEGTESKYVYYTPYVVCVQTSVVAYKHLQTIQQTNVVNINTNRVYIEYEPFVKSIGSVYWREAVPDQKDPLNAKVVSMTIQADEAGVNQWKINRYLSDKYTVTSL